MIDEWTDEWKAENEIYGDIVNINSSFSGYAQGYGEKLYSWYRHVAKNYPKGTIVGKSDDDFYGCANLYDVGKGKSLSSRVFTEVYQNNVIFSYQRSKFKAI